MRQRRSKSRDFLPMERCRRSLSENFSVVPEDYGIRRGRRKKHGLQAKGLSEPGRGSQHDGSPDAAADEKQTRGCYGLSVMSGGTVSDLSSTCASSTCASSTCAHRNGSGDGAP
mmetsp:Transcript_26188/g.60210  ORF Transcript_26188/g.60210 Transcript_26188/m.60210 type:complete len:114 (-) Transcript_26188:133-474(-)